MATTLKRPRPPGHLSPAAKAWWRRVADDYELRAHHFELLNVCASAWDRCEQARKIIAKEGPVYKDASGHPRKHPAVAIEADARIGFMRALRELGLDAEGSPTNQPPRIGGQVH